MTAHVSSAFAADPELIEALVKQSQPLRLDPHRPLFRQGDPPIGIFILKKGTALLTMQVGDRTVVQVSAGGGSLFGLPGVLGEAPYSLTAEVLEGSEVAFLSKENFARLVQSEPYLSFLALKVLAAEVHLARKSLSDMLCNG